MKGSWPLVALAVCGLTACQGTLHKVQVGDSAKSLSAGSRTDVSRLMWANGLQSPWDLEQREIVLVPAPLSATTVAKVQQNQNRAKAVQKAAQLRVYPLSSSPARSSKPANVQAGIFSAPVESSAALLMADYGKQNGLKHHGIDLSAPEGTPVMAAASGKVIYCGNGVRGYGNLIIIKHQELYTTVYANNKDIRVAVGDLVQRGEVIASVGNSSQSEDAQPHLHFELRHGVQSINPLQAMNATFKSSALALR